MTTAYINFTCFLIGCAFGNILTAAVITRGEIFHTGSGNPGFANTARSYGKGVGFLVLIGDILKTEFAVLACRLLFPDAGHIITLWAGLGACVGHCYPVWHHLKGGKAVTTAVVTMILYAPVYGLVSACIGLIFVALKLGLAAGALVIAVSYSICLYFAAPAQAFLLSLALTALILVRNALKTPGLCYNNKEKARP